MEMKRTPHKFDLLDSIIGIKSKASPRKPLSMYSCAETGVWRKMSASISDPSIRSRLSKHIICNLCTIKNFKLT